MILNEQVKPVVLVAVAAQTQKMTKKVGQIEVLAPTLKKSKIKNIQVLPWVFFVICYCGYRQV
jgi:hypothetical protein